jgi:hypothetical protein
VSVFLSLSSPSKKVILLVNIVTVASRAEMTLCGNVMCESVVPLISGILTCGKDYILEYYLFNKS